MKRLWMRAHALQDVAALADGDERDGLEVIYEAMSSPALSNYMVISEISDELAARVARDGFLMASGKVLAEGEVPPYVGEDKG